MSIKLTLRIALQFSLKFLDFILFIVISVTYEFLRITGSTNYIWN